ncbi:protein transport protein Sec16A isoform X3 [Vombatus ursinus]|uniref:Protein transport protein sec16 n=1 Tax=Vombatus ursinus TaxID=29139 RepID=A0A4X2KHX0_VOMUR|nr:protein transport protein Sec16A isoform X3 [Vombatus ursinus]
MMQPPPQTVPSGTGGPPPVGGPRNMYWSNSPFSRRANAPVTTVAGPVQPVTDPFAFGRQTPQGTALGNPSKGNSLVMQGPSPPIFSQPPGMHVPHTHAGDNSQGPYTSLSGPVSQPGVNTDSFTNILAPAVLPGHVMNSSTEIHPTAEPGIQASSVPSHYNPGAGLENSFGEHLQSGVPLPCRPLSRQDPNGGTTASFFPQPHQQTPVQWRPVQGSPQSSVQNYSPYIEPPSQNAVSLASGSSHFLPQANMHQVPGHQQHVPLVSTSGPLVGNERNEMVPSQSNNYTANNFQPENMFRQNPGVNSSWPSQDFRQNLGVSKQQLPDLTLINPIAQGNSLENQPQYRTEAVTSHVLPEANSGTITMFFKGEEAENEENLSSEKADTTVKSDFDGFLPDSGHGGHHLPHPMPVGASVPFQASVHKGSANESAQQGIEAQQYFSQSTSNQHDKQTTKNCDIYVNEDKACTVKTCGAIGSQYENVENLECIQNQEVPPSEPPNLNPSSSNDQFRYGPLPGQSVSKHSIVSYAEGGPNLEAPDSIPHPVRSDSVSSSYSSVSHRSISSSTRPQESVGTFIQQEVGKPNEETSDSFFKQIDSSPLVGETNDNINKNYHSSLSQPPTPSPPKPTGIFQTSANSSFEPVRSHGVGVKPVEADRANVVGELRKNHSKRNNSKPTVTVPAASPGNLEQPPDNMETFFTPHAHPLPLATTDETVNVLPHGGGGLLENVPMASEKRPSRPQVTTKKCESPATTLWAQNELPNFGGNVLLAPAAPALCVPAKTQASEIIQPPDEGLSSLQPCKPGSIPMHTPQDGNVSSENLENPPKMGEEEALQSQASSGYASLLSSPPTESLQNQPILIAQPNQSCNLTQPINFSVSLSNQLNHNENNRSCKDPAVGDKSAPSSQPLCVGVPGESIPLSGTQATSPVNSPLPTNHSHTNFSQSPGTTSEMVSNQSPNLLVQPPSHQMPLNLVPEYQKNQNSESVPSEFAIKPVVNLSASPGSNLPTGNTGVMLVPPVNSTLIPHANKANLTNYQEETSGALDFTLSRTLESHSTDNSVQAHNTSHASGPTFSHQAITNHKSQPGPELHDKEHFYQQVTKDVQHQIALDKSQPEALPPQQQGSPAAQVPKTVSDSSNSGKQPDLLPSGNSPQLPSQGKVEQQQLSQSSSIPATSAHFSQPASQQEQQWPPSQTPQNAFGPPQNLSAYYYYRHLYDTYQPQYPPPYPSDPRTASLYYPEDAYGPYDPRYRHYDKSVAYAENYRYAEPERPSSRASHCSDRPSSRQGYPEGYYASKGGWSSHSDYYANYYSGQYDYGDTNRWERYQYDHRFRDPRSYDRRYWYDTEHDYYRKEAYPYGDRHEKYDDHWRYDPRFAGSFDDEPEPHRDAYDDDRRSIHSEHSAHSLHSTHSLQSRQSSFSSRSHQSQVYRNNDVTANSYERPAAPASLPGDYSYGVYGNNFNGAQGFTEYGYPTETGWPTSEQVPSRPTTPEKFSVPHVCARFGPGGHLIKVLPNLPSEGQPALVEIHSMETMLQHTSEQEEMRSFPGPLAKDDTHKVDVINFAQNKATECLRNENLIDKESASLLWDFIVLLCRQNGTVVGTDIAELLLRDHKTVWLPGKSPNEANLIDFTNEAVEQVEEEESGEAQLSFLTDSLITTIDSLEKETERFRELLLYGRRKDALESAMKHGLWGHALLLASKMDSRTHARVMTRFANSLPINDPLQTVYQLMSGRMPAASTCCGDEKWGDWRPHLAMVLSNLNNNMDVESRTIATMGDTLASKGLLDAAHFCYLMAQIGFGVYAKKTTKLVLIGSNHSLPFLKFATNEAIHRTEAYEYAQSLGTQPCFLPNFQVFKFIYACRLAEMGLAAQAFHYCEVISKTILKQPRQYSPVLISQLIQIASQLRLFDPQIKEKPEQESFIEPTWLIQLQQLKRQIEEGDIIWNQDRATPRQYPSTPSSELEQYDGTGHGQEIGPGTDNPLLASLLPNTEQSNQNIRLMPSAPQTILENSGSMPASFQQEKPDNVPFYPVPPGPIGHTPVYGPLVSVPGFSDPYGPEHTTVYPGPNVSPGGQPLQLTDQLPEESRNQDTGRVPQESSIRNSISEQREEDFGGKFANMASGRRSRTTSQSSAHMEYSRKCQNTESYKGRERSNSAGQQPSPPSTFAAEVKRPTKEVKKEPKEPKKSGESWFSRWLHGKKKTEAYLPDDTNKSIVWDGKKQRWVNLDEPEEENKPPPPPPTAFPKFSQVAAPPGPGGSPNTSVNMFSRKAAETRARYVDVLNPSGTKQSAPVPAPSDLFAPLAPLPIPSNLFVPNSEEQPLENSGLEGQTPDAYQPDPEPATEPQLLNSATLLPGSENSSSNMDGRQSGELSRCSSMSSLSREVSQHFNQPPNLPSSGGATVGTVPFYNPSQFAQPSAITGSSRLGRIGQRKYPTLK